MLRFGELFCGAGGMALGLRQAGFQPLWAVDRDRDACATYRHNIGDHVICAGVEDVDYSSLAGVDGLAFGFPCNDFSVVGEKKGTSGYFGGLFRYAAQAIEDTSPAWFIAENVPGLLSSGGLEVMQAFADAGPGYSVAVHAYHFEDYGVPQKRHRVIGVGIRQDLGLSYRPPTPTHPEPVTASQALYGVEKAIHNNQIPRHSPRVVNLLSHIPPGGNCWSSSVPKELQLNVPRVRMSLIYRRLHPHEPAATVVAAGGGGTHSYHWRELRALTNRERARLQTFPDSFEFLGAMSSVRKQIGMAVPPLGALAVAKALRSLLFSEEYESVEPSVGILSPG